MIEVRFDKVELFADGESLGNAGAYERIVGVAYGALDPRHPANAAIVNLDKAPTNAAGLVAYEMDIFILRPVDPAKRNGKVFYDVTNRGNKPLLPWVNEAPETVPAGNNDPRVLADAGNRFLLRDGWTIVWSGWDGTVAPKPHLLGIRLPAATDGGKTIVKRIREDFIFGPPPTPAGNVLFALTYEVADPNQDLARLTIRYREKDERIEIPRDRWAYAGKRGVKLLPEGTEFERAAIYDFWYPAQNPLVLGIGFAAVRDLLSWLRFESGERVQAVIGFGVSVSGRFMREFLYLGMNKDHAGRKLMDGVFAYISGGSRTFVNFEFGQPWRTRAQHRDHNVPEVWFPFGYTATRDPQTGTIDAILPGDSTDPKVFSVNSSSEYWSKGASLTHTEADGTADVALPDNVRAFLIAGTQHDAVPSQQQDRGVCACMRNPHSSSAVLRALITALDQWVCEDRPPPASLVPTLAAKTLVAADMLGFPAIPGLRPPEAANDIVPLFDWVDPPRRIASPYRPLVCAVDDAGNEIAGIRTPDIAVPIGTYTGWNFHATEATAREVCNQSGSFVPFARTRSEADANGDPRRSLEELYGDKKRYIEAVRAATTDLVRRRLLLAEDGEAYVRRAEATTSL